MISYQIMTRCIRLGSRGGRPIISFLISISHLPPHHLPRISPAPASNSLSDDHITPSLDITPNLAYFFFFQFEIFSAGFSFRPFGFSYYLLHTLSPLITNVTPLRVPLGASLPLNLRPRGKFPLMLTIGGKNNMSPAHKDKVFC